MRLGHKANRIDFNVFFRLSFLEVRKYVSIEPVIKVIIG